MPISFSAVCNMSFVMRGAGVGDGKGVGVGEGVWARAGSVSFEAAKLASPRAGKTLTNERRSSPWFASRFLDSVFRVCVFFVLTKSPFEGLFAMLSESLFQCL